MGTKESTHWLDVVERFKAAVKAGQCSEITGKPVTVQDAPELFLLKRDTLLDYLAAAARLTPESLAEARNINSVAAPIFWVGLVKVAGIHAKTCLSVQEHAHRLISRGMVPTVARTKTSAQIATGVCAAYRASDAKWRPVFDAIDAAPDTIHDRVADGTLAPGGIPLGEDGLPICFSGYGAYVPTTVVKPPANENDWGKFKIGPDILIQIRASASAPGLLWVRGRFRFPYLSGVSSRASLPNVLKNMMEAAFERGSGDFVTHKEVIGAIDICSQRAKKEIVARPSRPGKSSLVGAAIFTEGARALISKIRSQRLDNGRRKWQDALPKVTAAPPETSAPSAEVPRVEEEADDEFSDEENGDSIGW